MIKTFTLLGAASAALATASMAHADVTVNFPGATSQVHTQYYDGSNSNSLLYGLFTAGDYVEQSFSVPSTTYDAFNFTTSLTDYTLGTDEDFSVLLNGAQIGSFQVTPTEAATDVLSASGSFSPVNPGSEANLEFLLASTVPPGEGSVAFDGDGAFTLTSSVSAAPEPSTWALMIAGVAMVGGMLRFRRREAFATA